MQTTIRLLSLVFTGSQFNDVAVVHVLLRTRSVVRAVGGLHAWGGGAHYSHLPGKSRMRFPEFGLTYLHVSDGILNVNRM
jgi:hypothetical protein